MTSMQSASYIIDIWLQYKETAEIFEHLTNHVNLQHLVKSRTQTARSIATREIKHEKKQTQN